MVYHWNIKKTIIESLQCLCSNTHSPIHPFTHSPIHSWCGQFATWQRQKEKWTPLFEILLCVSLCPLCAHSENNGWEKESWLGLGVISVSRACQPQPQTRIKARLELVVDLCHYHTRPYDVVRPVWVTCGVSGTIVRRWRWRCNDVSEIGRPFMTSWWVWSCPYTWLWFPGL